MAEELLKSQLLKNLSQETLKAILKKHDEEEIPGSKSALMETIVDVAYDYGVHALVSKIDLSDITNIHNDANGENDSFSNREMAEEKFFQNVEKMGLDDLLSKVKKQTLQSVASHLGITKKSANVLDVTKEVMRLGTVSLLDPLSGDQIKKIASEASIKSQKKDSIVSHVFSDKSSKKKTSTKKKASTNSTKKKASRAATPSKKSKAEKPKKKKEKPPKEEKKSRAEKDAELKANRPALQKGITSEELHGFYWQDELKQFCQEHEIKSTGSKKQLIKRIVKYFETGEKEPPGIRGGRGRKRKRDTEKDTPSKKAKTE